MAMVMMVDMVLKKAEATDCLLDAPVVVIVMVDENDSMTPVEAEEAVSVHAKEGNLGSVGSDDGGDIHMGSEWRYHYH